MSQKSARGLLHTLDCWVAAHMMPTDGRSLGRSPWYHKVVKRGSDAIRGPSNVLDPEGVYLCAKSKGLTRLAGKLADDVTSEHALLLSAI